MYDYIVCGAGSSGSTVAGRLAEDPGVTVLLIEAGGDDSRESIQNPDLWPLNLGTDAVWNFTTAPSPALGGRSLDYAMGRALGGGSSVNVANWVRGHRSDWDHFAEVTGDPVWGFAAVRALFERIESGPMRLEAATPRHPLGNAVLDAAQEAGFPLYPNPNGALMEAERGCAPPQKIVQDGRRRSPYRAYVAEPDRPNLTVLTGTSVRELLFDRDRAVGVCVNAAGPDRDFYAGREIVLSLGAINTPKVLMLSGIGDPEELRRHGIPVRRNLPGVGRNLTDHALLPLVWQATPGGDPAPPGDVRAACFWQLTAAAGDPPTFMYLNPAPEGDVITFVIGMPMRGTGRVRLASTDPDAAPIIETGFFTDPADIGSALRALDTARAIGKAPALRPFLSAELLPGAADAETYVRENVETYWHQSGTARMGRDEHAVVDSRLRVIGCEGLRVADASVLPSVTMANTMAPSVLVGEQAAAFISATT
ncbi:GMC family oxidoreductase [Actinoplanes sp. RD1]|uniref:GMC family oxidoreductase n=1 Tax=Actinoplanes sp. RD1 TaxID=3064538 RepID=UPI002741CE47|nr:GMC family oxidoreductase N-terminal domain-containing protein [Actinoplanes sp. RD1]